MSAAFEQVVASCRARLTGAARPQSFDAAALSYAEHHGVLPLLLPNDHSATPALRRIAKTQLVHAHELRRITDHLRGHIDFLALKGPALAVQLYDNLAARESLDLDLLVRPVDVPAALQAFRALDYSTPALGPRAMRHCLSAQHELPLYRSQGELLLELQWAWAQRHYAVDREVRECFDEAVEVSLAGTTVNVLSAEDTVLYLAVHGAKHGWSRLSLVTDFAAATMKLRPDWGVIQQRAARAGLGRVLEIAVELGRALFGCQVPIATDASALTLASIFSELLRNDSRTRRPFSLYLRSRERMPDRMRILWRLSVTPSPSDTSWAALPDRWFGAYYLLRPLRLLTRDPDQRRLAQSRGN